MQPDFTCEARHSLRGEIMKHKVLISGRNNALITDFIQQTEAFFLARGTSDNQQDILWHFKIFDPEAFVCFMERDYEKTVNQIKNLKASDRYNGAAIILIGDEGTCDLIEKEARFDFDLLVRRPVTPDNLTLRIIRFFDDMGEEKEERMARRTARQAETGMQQPPVKANAAVSGGVKKHILIVDDDRTVLKMLKSALEATYEITTMANGAMIDKLLGTKKVDLIILDYEMPIETGADIFRRLKKKPDASHIPVCFLTGVTEREKVMEIMLLKPDGYMLKPIDMEMLSSTIKNLTEIKIVRS